MIKDYQDAISVLKNKRSLLEKELEALDLAIDVLIEKSKTSCLDFSKFKPVLQANTRQVKTPLVYSSDLKYPSKIKALLNMSKALTISEMMEYIDVLEDIPDREKLFNGLTYAASVLHKKGVLIAERVGKANKYSLKEKPDSQSGS